MRQVFGGAILASAGIAAFIEAHTYKPHRPEIEPLSSAPLSRAAYDLIRIAGWMLVIFGAVIIITGLIRYWAQQTQGMEEELKQLSRTNAKRSVGAVREKI
jgi:hypothetical protein